MAGEQNVVELLLKVHAGLTKLVAPATPETLRATQPPPGRQRLLGGMPLIIKGTIIAALISLIGFLYTVPKPPENKTVDQATPAAAAKPPGKPTPAPAPPAVTSPQPNATEAKQ